MMTGMQAEAEESAELNRGAQLGQHDCLQGCVCVCEFSRGLTQKMGATERQGRTFKARWRGSSTIIATVQKNPLYLIKFNLLCETVSKKLKINKKGD